VKLTMLCKDSGSGGSGCPSVYVGEDGDFVVQGVRLDSDTFSNLENVLPGETAVRISPEVILGAVERYTARDPR
jgi:hypothetical protein